jgi:signal transduction histidine kinase
MTSIRSFSDILRDGDIALLDQKRYSGIIHDEAIRLTGLLDDLLDLSVLENGQVMLHLNTGNLAQLMDRATGAAGGLDDSLEIICAPELADVQVTTDLDRLVQVFINLIANARKYCDAPTCRLKISHLDRGEWHCIDFVDNGSGIAVENQQLIFEKFSRVADGSKAGGAGLGLAICREIMRRLGGDVAYYPGQSGTAFRVTLPKEKPADC